VKLVKMAADQNNTHEPFNYGVLLSEFARSNKDLHETLRYIKMSAGQRLASGQVNSGVFLFDGAGVEAARHLKATADQCDNEANWITKCI
jgi:TPR repeat protein